MSLSQRFTMTIVASILVVAVFLFGGGFTAYAASSSLPGDALYPVKTSLENTRASLTNDDVVKSNLYLGFASSRLVEIKSLIAEARFNQVPQTAAQFEKDIEKAQEAINHLAKDNPARAAELNAQAANILKGFKDTLSAMLTSAPLDVQPVIQNAMNASNPAVGSMDNSNANTNDDHGIEINNNANTNEDINDDNGIDMNNNANANEDINDDNGIDMNNNANVNEDINDNRGNDNPNSNTNTNLNTNTNTNDNHGHGDGGGGGGGSDGGGSGGGGHSGGDGGGG